ncbi:sensor histidine kinase [Gaetbulibacter aestuarii]|uniref:histidine kinase n=1 Tax=Gaetbulibacter aestuarii TaxID=1502358 RepID=A0ABW7MVG2_9FLAO
MSKRTIYIAIFVISIITLFVVQYQYLKIGLNVAKVKFNRDIGESSQQIKQELGIQTQLTFLIGRALVKDDKYFNMSLDSMETASKNFLDDFLKYRLSINGIKTDFSYRLFTRDSTFYLKSAHTFAPDTKLETYPIELQGYLPKLVNRQVILELQFKDLNSYFLSQLNGLTIPSILCLLVIIVIFVWVLRSVYWQHKVITTTNAFINNLTHELKTPVFSIGLATKILEPEVPSTKKQFINIIKQQTERLNKHIDKVLELGKLEFQKKVFKIEPLDFYPNLKKLCEDFEALSSLQNIQFSYSLEGDTYPIKAEATHLENAISNILDNAQKYSDDPMITLKAKTTAKVLEITVSDNGIGMSKKEKSLIFKKYYRVGNDELHKVKGYGLGLSYVKDIIKKHKGKIKIDSTPGSGTSITIIIPLNHG